MIFGSSWILVVESVSPVLISFIKYRLNLLGLMLDTAYIKQRKRRKVGNALQIHFLQLSQLSLIFFSPPDNA